VLHALSAAPAPARISIATITFAKLLRIIALLYSCAGCRDIAAPEPRPASARRQMTWNT
jgi:hypothetical protein